MVFKRNTIVHGSLFLFFCSFLIIGCHKEKSNTEIKDVTGYAWKVGVIWGTGDYYIQPIPGPWELELNSDRSFSFNLNGSVCNGTYSWNTIDSIGANISFSIKKWSNPSQNETVNKLKNVLNGINKCYCLKGPNIPPIFSGFTNPAMVLDLEGSDGYIYVYR